jgi:hypothetical protein
MRDNEQVQHPSRPSSSTGLSGTQFSTLNSAGINDPEGPEKYNNTEVKYGATFYSCQAALASSIFLQKSTSLHSFLAWLLEI